MLCNSGKRRQNWVVERHEKKHLLTVLGDVYAFVSQREELHTTADLGFIDDQHGSCPI